MTRPTDETCFSAPSETIAVIGAGSWGTALAIHLARNGHTVRLWGRDPATMAELHDQRANTRYLPGITFPDALSATAELDHALADADGCLVAVPSHALRATLERLGDTRRPPATLAWATKGLDPASREFPHQLVGRHFPHRPMAVISGPTFAGEVAAGRPTAVTVASDTDTLAHQWIGRLHGPTFRAYSCHDIIGVELGGAVKNVLAIATGIADGLRLGANTRAALITRGLAETMRLGQRLGAQSETFMGLAGMGDLVLTCTDDQSRNRRFGLALGHGDSVADARGAIDQVVEGEPTSLAIRDLARELDVEMPIVEEVHRVLHEGVSPAAAVDHLLARDPKPEY
ncbi:MAG: NAD(P)H-dependent glycerol-3-phosphate dehydrogenase [Pseudomonadota bacterium]